MKRLIAVLITCLLLGFALWWARSASQNTGTPTGESPEQCIQRMFAAAEQGDVDAYLACFTGPERTRLEGELADQSRRDFADALQNAVATLKGRAVFAPDPQQPLGDTAEIDVERVYATRTERQTYRLVRQRGRWQIYQVQTAEAYQPAKPYGTPVFEMPDQAPGSGGNEGAGQP